MHCIKGSLLGSIAFPFVHEPCEGEAHLVHEIIENDFTVVEVPLCVGY